VFADAAKQLALRLDRRPREERPRPQNGCQTAPASTNSSRAVTAASARRNFGGRLKYEGHSIWHGVFESWSLTDERASVCLARPVSCRVGLRP
jgi:hypothetical protein